MGAETRREERAEKKRKRMEEQSRVAAAIREKLEWRYNTPTSEELLNWGRAHPEFRGDAEGSGLRLSQKVASTSRRCAAEAVRVDRCQRHGGQDESGPQSEGVRDQYYGFGRSDQSELQPRLLETQPKRPEERVKH